MKVVHVPLEKIPTRYTAEWTEQFESEFKANSIEFVTVCKLDEAIPIENGSVLDCYRTNQYKMDQLKHIIDMIQNGEVDKDTVIFFADLWFPGIESLFYIRNISGIDFKIAGIFHAGTWNPHDFTSRTGMRNWGQHIEMGWLQGVDMVFVATKWHKRLIIMNSGSFDKEKIHVTGIPFYAKSLQMKYPMAQSKENIVVFPHRLEQEKHPEKFDRLARKHPQWRFIKTMGTCGSRESYFRLLAQTKVMISYADQETFGYSTVEAMALGNYVIVPNDLSYRETVPEEFRYNNEKQIPGMLEDLMSRSNIAYYPELDKWSMAVSNMIKAMIGGIETAKYTRIAKEQAITDVRQQAEDAKKLRRGLK